MTKIQKFPVYFVKDSSYIHINSGLDHNIEEYYKGYIDALEGGVMVCTGEPIRSSSHIWCKSLYGVDKLIDINHYSIRTGNEWYLDMIYQFLSDNPPHINSTVIKDYKTVTDYFKPIIRKRRIEQIL